MDADRCELLCLDLTKAERLRGMRLQSGTADAAARRAQALADPTRMTVAAALREVDELCVCDLAWVMERSQNLVSHHVRALRAQGLVASRREGKMVMYWLTPSGVVLVDAMLSASPANVEAIRG